MTTWTAENVARLRSMFAEGATRTEMAQALGFADRGAVCGKLNRMGLTGKGPSARLQPNGTTSNWTKDHERRLIEMWPDWSISASQIARELGGNLTRSSVSNRARRLIREGKLKPRGRVLTGRRKPKGKHHNHALGYQIQRKSKTPIEVAPIAAATEAAAPGAILITDLAWNHCRWPQDTEPQSFCGAARQVRMMKGGTYLSPYCCNHSRMAYRPQP